jgi:hypothetical protein
MSFLDSLKKSFKDVTQSLKDQLYAVRDGLWGRADNNGSVAPYTDNMEELPRFSHLSLETTAESPFCLDTYAFAMLYEAVDDKGTSIKYEGVPLENHGDGYLDIRPAELPGGEPSFLLEDRWSDGRFLVLRQPWRKLPTGSVLALRGGTCVQTVEENSDESLFLNVVLGVLEGE